MRTRIALACLFLFVGTGFASAASLRRVVEPYRVLPTSGTIEIIAGNPPTCPVADMVAVQISAANHYSNIAELARVMAGVRGEQLADGCGYAARLPQVEEGRVTRIAMTRWVDENEVPALLRSLKSVGDIVYADLIPHDKLSSDTAINIAAIEKRLREDEKIRNDTNVRKGLKQRLGEMRRELRGQKHDSERVLVHVTLNAPVSGMDGSAQMMGDTRHRIFLNAKRHLLEKTPSPMYRASALELLAWGINGEARGAVGGIGALLTQTPSGVALQALGPVSPASRAGLSDGDIIISVNGAPAVDKNVEQLVSVILGASGSSVEIGVRRVDGSERQVKVVRDALVPTRAEITEVADSCSKSEDRKVKAYCLGALATDRMRRDEASLKLAEILSDPISEIRVAGLTGLIEAWRLTIRSGRRLPPVVVERPIVPFDCPAGKQCTLLKTTGGLVLTSRVPYAGVKSISLKGKNYSATAEFGCGMHKRNESAAFGAFYGLSTGTYISTVLGCHGMASESTIVAIPGKAALELCAEVAGVPRNCASTKEIDIARLRGDTLDLLLVADVSTGAAKSCSMAELCQNISWPHDVQCEWKSKHRFVFSARVSQRSSRRIKVEDRGRCGVAFEKLTLGVRVTQIGVGLATTVTNLPAKGSILFTYDLPDIDPAYPVSSTDSVVHLEASFSRVIAQSRDYSKEERGAFARQVLQPAGSAYWVGDGGGSFVFVATGPIRFAYPYSKTPDGSAIYRYDDGIWSSAAVTNQRLARDEGISTLSGQLVRSGVYAVFSSIADKRPPETVLSFSGQSRKEDGYFVVSPYAQLVLSARDPLISGRSSGLATTYYRIDGEGGDAFTAYPAPIPLPIGAHEIEYYAVDWSGNEESRKRAIALVTNSTPTHTTGNRHVKRDLLLGYLRSEGPAALEVQSAAENSFTFWGGSELASPALGVTNIGSTALGVRNPQATLDAAGRKGVPNILLRSSVGPQIIFGSSSEAPESPALNSRHGENGAGNGLDFGFYSAPPDALFRPMFSLEAAGAHVCPIGPLDSELEVSDGARHGGGTVRRLEAQTPAAIVAPMDAAGLAAEQTRALRDVLGLKPALLSDGRDPASASPRRGLLAEESPESIRGPGGTVLLTERLTNLELALQQSLARIVELEQRLKAARAKGAAR